MDAARRPSARRSRAHRRHAHAPTPPHSRAARRRSSVVPSRPPSGERARRRAVAGPAPRLARRSARAVDADVDLAQLHEFLLPGRHAVPPVRARGRARRQRARRAIRGDQSPLHDQRDPRPHRRRSTRRRARSSREVSRDGRRAPRVDPRARPRAPTRCAPSPRSARDVADVPPIALDDQCSVSAHVFRTQHSDRSPRTDEMPCDAEARYRRGAMLSVPIMWTRPHGRQRAARRRESLRSPLGPAVHRRRPEAHRGDRDADRHRDPERAARARVGRAAAARARDAARARPADEAAARATRSSRRRRRSRRASFRRRASAATSTICSGSASGRTGVMIGDVSGHGYQAALIMALTMSASAIHAQAHRPIPARCSTRSMSIAARRADDDGDVHLGVLRRRSIATHGELRYAQHGPSARVRRLARRRRRATRRERSAARHGRRRAGDRDVGRGTPAAICSCCSPTASATRAIATASARRGAGARRRARHRARGARADRVDASSSCSTTTPATTPRRDDLTLVILKS